MAILALNCLWYTFHQDALVWINVRHLHFIVQSSRLDALTVEMKVKSSMAIFLLYALVCVQWILCWVYFDTRSQAQGQSQMGLQHNQVCWAINQSIYKRRDLTWESIRFFHVAHFLKFSLYIWTFTSIKFAFISKYQFIELANRVNAYTIKYLLY